jgi:hypothetical protein
MEKRYYVRRVFVDTDGQESWAFVKIPGTEVDFSTSDIGVASFMTNSFETTDKSCLYYGIIEG